MYTAGITGQSAQNSLSAPSLAEAASQRVVRARSVTIMEPFEDRRVQQHADTPTRRAYGAGSSGYTTISSGRLELLVPGIPSRDKRERKDRKGLDDVDGVGKG